jgi:intracellular multiplication protein IcmB
MSISTKLISGLDVLLSKIKKDLYYDIQDYCFLETATDKHYFTAHDGSLVTVFSIKGIGKVVNKIESIDVATDLYKKLKSSFKEDGHALQFVYSKDADRTEEALINLLKPFIKETKKMQMNADFLFKDKINNLLNFTCYEDNYLVVWSRPTLIKSTIKKENEDYYEELGKTSTYSSAQQVMLNYKNLENKHKALLKIIINAFKSTGISSDILKVNETSNVIKSSINSETTSAKWKARLPDKAPVMRDNDHDLTIGEEDISYLLYPNLKKQLIPQDMSKIDNNTIKIGERYVSSMFVDIPQEDPTPFYEFVDLVDKQTPFQISFKMEGGGLNGVGLKKFLSSILAWSPGSNNKLIKESIEAFSRQELNGESITKNGISLNTWADNEDLLATRKQELFKAIQSWGSQTPVFTNDDPYEGFFNSVPAFFPKIVGNNFLNRMDNILFTVPLTRQANIWDEGCIINRTLDGKIMPYQVASKKQASWNELVFAKPGSGKSVWSNYSNFSFCISPKSSKLCAGKFPFVGIIDIGPSSLGLIRLLHSMLPESRKKEAVYYKLSNTKEDAINVFDTQLGCRQPTEKEKSFLIRFISLLLTPAGSAPIASLDTMVNNVVTALYKNYHDDNQPKEYEPYINEEVDNMLNRYNMKAKGRTWWWVVDKLFEKEELDVAKVAQRYAVPKLEDCVKVCNTSENIKTSYSKPKVQATGENMLDYFVRVVGENINLYPILNAPTELNLESARVISLDLNDVAPDGDATAKKQCGIFYMLARFVVTKNFFLDKKVSTIANKQYQSYQEERCREHFATPKRLCIDELHRTGGIEDFREQIKQDMREGRKWSLSICLISQLIEDFDSNMVDLCNSKFILSGGDNYKKIAKKFDFGKEISEIIRTDLNGPTSEGVPFVVKFSTKKGEYTQYLYNTLSSMERWAFSSTTEDDQIRSMCEDVFGNKRSLQILSESFPEGTIADRLEKLMNSSEGQDIASPIDHFMDRIKIKYKKEIIL